MTIQREIPKAQRTTTETRPCGCTYYGSSLYEPCDALVALRGHVKAALEMGTRARMNVKRRVVADRLLRSAQERVATHKGAIDAR